MALRTSGIPGTTVYRVKLASMAAMAASLMWRGVGKCGSPAPKSTRLAPWARSLAASAATAMVAETSIRPMRSAKTFVGVETVMMLLSLQISRQSPSPVSPGNRCSLSSSAVTASEKLAPGEACACSNELHAHPLLHIQRSRVSRRGNPFTLPMTNVCPPKTFSTPSVCRY